jgi:hypothetical protein
MAMAQQLAHCRAFGSAAPQTSWARLAQRGAGLPCRAQLRDAEARCESRQHQQQQQHREALVLACSAAALALAAGPAAAFEIHQEPANALSLPTWAIHVSSVVEWIAAMGLM